MAIFTAKKWGFLVMAAPKQLTTCTKNWQNTFFEFNTLKIGLGGPTSDHSGPTNTVLGQKVAFFGHFLG